MVGGAGAILAGGTMAAGGTGLAGTMFVGTAMVTPMKRLAMVVKCILAISEVLWGRVLKELRVR